MTRQDVTWQWNHAHEAAFEQVKRMVTSAPLLKYYDPQLELTVQCDASEKGLGAALLQKGQPIAFASCALTDAETRYAQIEKEMLAVVFSLKKFDQYVYGRKTTVLSDHKPLEAIAKKPLRSAPRRLQGMLLKAQRYDIEIVYQPGTQMYLADTLSRAFLNSSENSQGEFERVNAVKFLTIPENRLEHIKRSTDEDEVLQQLKTVIQQGWLDTKEQLTPTIAVYFGYRDELSVYNGLVFKGERLIIPKPMRKEMKQELHSSHIGINGCIRRARECMFWPGMSAEVKEFVLQCDVCRTNENKQQKEPLTSQEPTDRPWERVGTDIFTLNGKDYLLLVDYFSNFWEVNRLPDTRASTCIRKMKSHFARNGIPDVVISDNGSQFTSSQFSDFAKEWQFEHRTSSPHHQQANGQAESAVKTAKKLIRKAEESGKDLYLALLDMRNTPSEGYDTSPAQRLLGRRCKTLLPTTPGLLKASNVNHEKISEQTRQRQLKQAKYYNRGAKSLPPLQEGDTVRMRPYTMGSKVWPKAVVSERLDERSSIVDTDKGSYRRNRVDIKTQEEQPHIEPSEEPPGTSTEEIGKKPAVSEVPKIINTKTEPVAISSEPVAVERHVRPKRNTKEPAYLKDYVRK